MSFWAISCPFSLLTIWKIKNLKLTKTTGNIIILHIGTINDNHIMYGSWDMERDRQFFVILDHFLNFYPPWTQKIKIFKKWKKHLKILSFYKYAPYMTVIWCMDPGIWSATDIIFVIFNRFLPFYYPNNLQNQNFETMKKPPGDIIILHRCTINDNHMMYGSWDNEHDTNFFCHFWPFFALLTSWKKQNFAKLKKTPGDIIILHMCSINDNHMMFGSSDMEWLFWHFQQFFTLLPP